MIAFRFLTFLALFSSSLVLIEMSFAVEKNQKASSTDSVQKKRVQGVEAAAKNDTENRSKSKPKRSNEDREKAAVDFVKQHHTELVEILKQLKEVSPREFEVAIRELAQTSEKLSRFKERDKQRYDIELKSWQARSRGELLAAQLQMDNTPKIREQFRKVLLQQTDLRVELMKLEESRLADRLEKIRQNIESLNKSRDKSADKRIARYTRSESDKQKDSKDK